jgi:hypothetical protein
MPHQDLAGLLQRLDELYRFWGELHRDELELSREDDDE